MSDFPFKPGDLIVCKSNLGWAWWDWLSGAIPHDNNDHISYENDFVLILEIVTPFKSDYVRIVAFQNGRTVFSADDSPEWLKSWSLLSRPEADHA